MRLIGSFEESDLFVTGKICGCVKEAARITTLQSIHLVCPAKIARIFIDFAECRLGATAICRGPAVRVPGGKNRRSSRPKPFPHASDSRPHAQAEGRNRPPFSQHTEEDEK